MSTEKRTILLVDARIPDNSGVIEYALMQLYVMALLEADFEVKTSNHIGAACKLISNEHFDFVSLGVLLPDPEHVFSREQTENGLFSGVAMFQWIIENIEPIPPVAFLTNAPIHLLKQRLDSKKLARHQHWVLQKSTTPPFDFVDFVNETMFGGMQ